MAFVATVARSFLSAGRQGGNRSSTAPVRASASASASSSSSASPNSDNVDQMRALLTRSLEKPLVVPDLFTSGECDCIWCDGTGQRRCAWCKGCGYREEILESSWQEIIENKAEMPIREGELELPNPVRSVCPLCSGSKKMNCSRCKGSGIGGRGHAH